MGFQRTVVLVLLFILYAVAVESGPAATRAPEAEVSQPPCPPDYRRRVESCIMEAQVAPQAGGGINLVINNHSIDDLCHRGMLRKSIDCLEEIHSRCSNNASVLQELDRLFNVHSWQQGEQLLCQDTELFHQNWPCLTQSATSVMTCVVIRTQTFRMSLSFTQRSHHSAIREVTCNFAESMLKCVRSPLNEQCPRDLVKSIVGAMHLFLPPFCLTDNYITITQPPSPFTPLHILDDVKHNDVTEKRVDVTHKHADAPEQRDTVSHQHVDVTEKSFDVTHQKSDVTEQRNDVTHKHSDVIDLNSDVAQSHVDAEHEKIDDDSVVLNRVRQNDFPVVAEQDGGDFKSVVSGVGEARSVSGSKERGEATSSPDSDKSFSSSSFFSSSLSSMDSSSSYSSSSSSSPLSAHSSSSVSSVIPFTTSAASVASDSVSTSSVSSGATSDSELSISTLTTDAKD